MSVKGADQSLIFQLYMNKDRKASEKLIKSLESRGFSAIMLTVDAAVAGKRELDQRAKGDIGSAVSAIMFCAQLIADVHM
jgi:L-lactate dehydrogenase (cytochrome)